jgi:Tol biopolymer transport system component
MNAIVNNMKKNRMFLVLIILLAIIAGGLLIFLTQYRNPGIGSILIRFRSAGTPLTRDLIVIMDGTGNNLQQVAESSGSPGSPSWSPDGHYLAYKCELEICILNMLTLPEKDIYWQQTKYPEIAYRLDLPSECKTIAGKREGKPDPRILSTSWSPDGQKLVIVCGDVEPNLERSVCTLPLEGEGKCWNKEISKNIYRVAWSPNDINLLAVAGLPGFASGSSIYLTDPEGIQLEFLAQGGSPEWSPSGKQLAFIRIDKDSSGIDIINVDGTNQRRIFLNEPLEKFINFECVGLSGSCRLAWSPDNRYIVFVSNNYIGYNYKIYRLELNTGKIVVLLDSLLFPYVAEVDWGP